MTESDILSKLGDRLAPIAAAYTAITLILLTLPLVNVLHAESCALLAAAAFFIGGSDAVKQFKGGEAFQFVLVRELALLLIPFTLFQMARAVIPGCDFLAGIQYFVLFTVISTVFAVSLAYAVTSFSTHRPLLWYWGIGLLAALSTVVWDLAFHPQFYVYNHVIE